MNHSINIGSTVDSLASGFLSTSNSKRKDSEFGSEFFSLLQNKLSFSSDSNQTAKTTELTFSHKSNGFEAPKNSANQFKAWERPEINKYERSESSTEQTQQSPKKIANADSSEESIKAERKVNETEKQLAKENSQIEAQVAMEETAKLALAEVSQDDINSLVEFMSQLDTSELEALSENPEQLVAQIVQAIEQLENPELKEELTSIVESENFAEFVGNLAQSAQLAQKANEQSQSMTNATSGESDVNQLSEDSVNLDAAGNQKKAQRMTANNSTSASQDSVEEVGQAQTKATETTEATEATKEVQDQSEEKGFKRLHNDRQKTDKKIVENSTLRNESTEITPKETLRQEHQKTVAKEVPVQATEADLETSESQSLSKIKPDAGLNNQASANKSVNVLPEEISKRFISLLTGNKSSAQTKSFTYSSYGPVEQKDTKASTSQNNANSGFGNGFSSNSGTTTAHATRQAPSGNNNVFLSQLLEKAEMIKFSDGKKVLSLEMDPKELGKMEMELTSKDGTVTAKISAESELARIKLEELAPQIKEQLSNQGINLAEITVDISSKHPDERNNKQMSNGQNKSSRTDKIGANSDEQIIRKNILPNLRKVALNIQSVDLTV